MTNKIVVTSPASFQAALTAAENPANNISLISIELPSGNVPTTMVVTNPFTLPSTLSVLNSAQKLIIEGNGVTFTLASNLFTGAMLFRNTPAFDDTNASFVIRDIHFNCSGSTNTRTGIELCNASDIIIENCKFSNSSFGLVMRNVNNAAVNNCQAVNISGYGYALDISGIYMTNTGCRNVTFNQCRFNNGSRASSTAIAFYFYRAARTVMNECISEGPVTNHIKFNSGGDSTINSFNVNNFTFNATNTPSCTPNGPASIYLSLSEGFAKLVGLYTNDSGVIVYAEPTNGTPTLPHLYIENVPFLSGQAKFQTIGGVSLNSCPLPTAVRSVVWEFNEIYQGSNIFGAGRWVNDLVPYYRYAEFFDESKKIITNSITINGNPV